MDAAASGRNVIEREGISFTHAAHFILVGTMNPEEGELRPQLLDRFGLCVEVASEKDVEKRAALMEQREAYDQAPRRFIQQFETENEKIAGQIMAAREVLPRVRLAGHLRTLVCELCTQNYVAGHRADLVIEQASRAMAALRGRDEVTVDDVREVAGMALAHRKRDAAPPPPPPPPDQDHDHDHETPPENHEDEPRKKNHHRKPSRKTVRTLRPNQ